LSMNSSKPGKKKYLSELSNLKMGKGEKLEKDFHKKRNFLLLV